MPTINLTCMEADEIFISDTRGHTVGVNPSALGAMLARVCFLAGLPMDYKAAKIVLPQGTVEEAEDYTDDNGAVGVFCGSVELTWPTRDPMTMVFVCVL